MATFLPVKAALIGLSTLSLALIAEIMHLRGFFSNPMSARRSLNPPLPAVPVPTTSNRDKPEKDIIFSLGHALGQRFLDVGGLGGAHAALALCEDGKTYKLIFETFQTKENTDMTMGRYFAGEIIDHVGARYRADRRPVHFEKWSNCVFMRGIEADDIKLGRLTQCNHRDYDHCVAYKTTKPCDSEFAELRSRNLLKGSGEVIRSLCKPINDDVFFVDLVSQEGSQCFYGAYFKIKDDWIALDGFNVDYRKYDESDSTPHCYVDGGDVYDEDSYFPNEFSSRLDIGLNFVLHGEFYFVSMVTYGETHQIVLHRIKDNKVEDLAKAGGYAVPF